MISRKMPGKAWAIQDRRTRELVIFDARCPVYWLRRIARDVATERGLTSYGSHADVEIVRVVIMVAK